VLNFPGKKKYRIELFDAELFRDRKDTKFNFGVNLGSRYRLRVNGKWWHGYPSKEGEAHYFTKTEIKEILFRGLKP
jgi:hypothetical protein